MVEEKKAFEEWLQYGSRENYQKYLEKKVEAKRKVNEEKMMANFRWGQAFNGTFEENKKKFWKEVKRVRKGRSRMEESVKDVDGRILKGMDVKKRWAKYFEDLLNFEENREAVIVAVGGSQMPVMREENEREITRGEVVRALKEAKAGKVPAMDGVRVEMLKSCVTAAEWLM